jgi:hypothetical protein
VKGIRRLAADNAQKIRAVLDGEIPCADLYRTIEAGPSGQRADLLVGRVYFRPTGPDEVEVRDPRNGELAGFARREFGAGWSITEVKYDGEYCWLGFASSLSVGVDALFNGVSVATGRHDSRRVSSGWVRRSITEAMEAAA